MKIVIDVEADGPYPGDYSIVSFAAVIVESFDTFYGKVKPVSEIWVPEALAVSGHSREEHSRFPEPEATMTEFVKWLEEMKEKHKSDYCQMWSDNIAFDWQFINYYILKYGTNGHKSPLGFSGRRIGDLYAGYTGDISGKSNREWKKKYRKTRHTHHPVDDAMGNAEALISIISLINQ